MGPKIKLLDKKDGEWFDIETRANERGIIYALEVEDAASGSWLLNVRVSNRGKIVVTAETSAKTTSLHEQIKRKSMVLKPCENGNVYQLLGIAGVENGRVSMTRIDSESELDSEFNTNFRLDKYSSVGKNATLNNKIIAVLGADEIEKMAYLFYLEKIKPIF